MRISPDNKNFDVRPTAFPAVADNDLKARLGALKVLASVSGANLNSLNGMVGDFRSTLNRIYQAEQAKVK